MFLSHFFQLINSNLPDGSYPISDNQNYFEFIIKKRETLTEYSPFPIYVHSFKKENCFQNTNRV